MDEKRRKEDENGWEEKKIEIKEKREKKMKINQEWKEEDENGWEEKRRMWKWMRREEKNVKMD